MKNDWEKAIAFVLKMEGGEQAENNPADPGGLTKFGISQKAYPNLDIANLTKEGAMEIYKRDYWDICKCDELPTPYAIALFDSAVNQGVGKASRILQSVLGVTPDGQIGPKTISACLAVWATEPRKLRVYLASRLAAYADLMAAKPTLLVWATNWSFRVIALAELILKEPPAAA